MPLTCTDICKFIAAFILPPLGVFLEVHFFLETSSPLAMDGDRLIVWLVYVKFVWSTVCSIDWLIDWLSIEFHLSDFSAAATRIWPSTSCWRCSVSSPASSTPATSSATTDGGKKGGRTRRIQSPKVQSVFFSQHLHDFLVPLTPCFRTAHEVSQLLFFS